MTILPYYNLIFINTEISENFLKALLKNIYLILK